MKKRMAACSLCLALLLTACGKTPDADTGRESKTQNAASKEEPAQAEEPAQVEEPASMKKPVLMQEPAQAEKLQTAADKAGENLKLYKDILDLYYKALYEHQTYPGQWEPDKYSAEQGLVPAIVNPYWAWEDADAVLTKEGFGFLDLNDDGVDELVIGWVQNECMNMEDGYIFAIYTIVDGEVTFAIEGWERCRYVAGGDGYLYEHGSSSAFESSYTKYRFNLEYEDFREPIEKFYSYKGPDYDIRWEHITEPEDIGVIEYNAIHEDLLVDGEEAYATGEGWMNSGTAVKYTLFSDYIYSE